MNSNLSPTFLAFADSFLDGRFTPPQLIAIVAVAGALLLTGVIVVFGIKYHQRQKELWHETARLALEKGQPLPPGTLSELNSRGRRTEERNDFRDGLILIATGAGLFLFLDALLGRWLAYVGAIPGFIGLALLLHAACTALFGRRRKDDRPTQS